MYIFASKTIEEFFTGTKDPKDEIAREWKAFYEIKEENEIEFNGITLSRN